MIPSSVAVIGSATIDTIIEGGIRFRQIGGVVTYAGITFRRHGTDTFVVTNVARDDAASFDLLRREGIRVIAGDSDETTHFVNYVDGFSRRQEMPRCARPIAPEQLCAVLGVVDHVHVGALHPRDISPAGLLLLRGATPVVSVDIQGFARFREEDGAIVPRVAEILPAVLSAAHFVKVDEAELKTILQACALSLSAFTDVFAIDEVVVTQGRRGGFVRTSSGVEYRYGAKPVDRVHSTVGAGDVFFADYLVHRLYDRMGIGASCEAAAALVARQIEGRYLTSEMLAVKHVDFSHQEC